MVNKTALERGSENNGPEIEFEVKYILNDIDCGSRKRVNTVREWLARFGIPEHDEFFLLWSKLTIKLHGMISELEKRHVSSETLNMFWSAIFAALYLEYDTSPVSTGSGEIVYAVPGSYRNRESATGQRDDMSGGTKIRCTSQDA